MKKFHSNGIRVVRACEVATTGQYGPKASLEAVSSASSETELRMAGVVVDERAPKTSARGPDKKQSA